MLRLRAEGHEACSLQHSTIFLSTTTPADVYGVLGLVSTIEETVPMPLPVYTQAVLLPFEHHIIYDSLLASYQERTCPISSSR